MGDGEGSWDSEARVMEVRQWVKVDETAKQMLLRVSRGKLPVLRSFLPLYRVSLHAGDVLEVAGPSGSAKSELLLQMAVECVLPKVCGGAESVVVWFDLDCRFDRLRFLAVVRSRLVKTMAAEGDEDGEGDWNEEELLAASLQRFCYVRCYNSIELLAALKTIGPRLKGITDKFQNGVRLFLIDSIGAYFWLDRACQPTSSAVAQTGGSTLSLQVVSEAVVRELRQLLHVHRMLVVASKIFLFSGTGDYTGTKADVPDDDDGTSARDLYERLQLPTVQRNKKTGKPLHREYMPPAWQKFVTHRLILQGPYYPEVPNYKSGLAPIFIAEWDKPSTDQADAFVVQDGGLKLIS